MSLTREDEHEMLSPSKHPIATKAVTSWVNVSSLTSPKSKDVTVMTVSAHHLQEIIVTAATAMIGTTATIAMIAMIDTTDTTTEVAVTMTDTATIDTAATDTVVTDTAVADTVATDTAVVIATIVTLGMISAHHHVRSAVQDLTPVSRFSFKVSLEKLAGRFVFYLLSREMGLVEVLEYLVTFFGMEQARLKVVVVAYTKFFLLVLFLFRVCSTRGDFG